MKKTYKNPTLKVVNVKPSTILAGSLPKGDSYNNEEILGRGSRYSSWEDDDAAVEE